MDTYLADIKALVERIDERTETIHEWIGKHEDQDRADFKEVHKRINKVERKQNWALGVISAAGFVITASIAWLKDLI